MFSKCERTSTTFWRANTTDGWQEESGRRTKVKTAEAVYENQVLSSLLQGDLKEIKRNFHLMMKSVVCALEVFHVLLHNRLLATPQLIRQTITLSQSPSTSNSTVCCSPRFTHNTQQWRGEKRELSNPQQLSGPCYSIIMFDYNLISHFYRLFCGQSERRVEKRDFHRHKMCLGIFSGFCHHRRPASSCFPVCVDPVRMSERIYQIP